MVINNAAVMKRERTLTEDGFEVAVVSDATAAARHPEIGDGYAAALTNFRFLANATWTNTIGDPELITVWKDPDFDPSVKAFYYARVLEIPTPRWTAYEQVRYGITLPDVAEMVTQERAYTSPIWYTPGK